MRSLSLVILFIGLTGQLFSQSPHGESLKINCAACHTTDGWEIPFESWNYYEVDDPKVSEVTGWELKTGSKQFSHQETDFYIDGLHTQVDCRECHQSLVFSEANSSCVSCHTDMHQQTVGADCARCHSTENWLVDNITELHEDNGFPLLGAHGTASCYDCHASETELRFDRIGNDCINCHMDEFAATTNPNHINAGYSTNCIDCHDVAAFDWSSEGILHDFFPLTLGHDIADCAQCHINGDFSNTPTDCVACHQDDFESTSNPDHQASGISMNCIECHTTDPGWMPAEFLDHDMDFPIYSGDHQGEWDECLDCHTNPSNFAEFTCITCHENPETDNKHVGEEGYSYVSTACLACHPNGSSDDDFDHNLTAFPLTGAHTATDCIDCHTNGFADPPPTDCAACHTTEFNQTTNPDHNSLGLSMDCAACHTTDPDWMPATFDIHDDFHPLNGAHAAIADCAACHNGDYNITPNTCIGCHTDDFNSTTDPNHVVQGYPTDCTICHSENAWVTDDFDHNATTNFPLTGGHIGVDCLDCHADGYTGTPTDCAACHTTVFNQTTNPNHTSLGLSMDCAACHTTDPDWMPATFDIHDDFHPLNGAHAAIADCAACHNGDYNNTPNTCFGCHAQVYNDTNDPDHQDAQFPTNCEACHNENAWFPSTWVHAFPIYDGRHDGEWVECIECHTNPGNYMQFSCIECHEHNDQAEVDDQHPVDQVPDYVYESNACYECHPLGEAD